MMVKDKQNTYVIIFGIIKGNFNALLGRGK